jgi:hypothetical protein
MGSDPSIPKQRPVTVSSAAQRNIAQAKGLDRAVKDMRHFPLTLDSSGFSTKEPSPHGSYAAAAAKVRQDKHANLHHVEHVVEETIGIVSIVPALGAMVVQGAQLSKQMKSKPSIRIK